MRTRWHHIATRWMFLIACFSCLFVMAGAAFAFEEGEQPAMKRRQQGILTGMPFMANVAQRTFVDDLGRSLYLSKTPTSIISLAPSITEILYAIGLDEQIVGVTQFCDYPLEAQRKPKVGYSTPNIETIVALQPDLVLAPREFLRADVLAKLDQLKIPTFILDAKTLDDVPAHIQMLGRILDRASSANTVAMEIRERITQIREKTQLLPHVRVLYVLNSQPLITVGPGSFIHQVIGLAGGSNVAGNASAPYPRLSMEVVLKEDPEVIVFPVGKTEGISAGEQQLWERWTSLTAVKHRRFHHVPSDVMNRPGPRIVEALEQMARILHPEAFEAKRTP